MGRRKRWYQVWVLTLYILFIIFLLWSGWISYFIHPKMNGFVIFFGVVLFVLDLFLIVTSQHRGYMPVGEENRTEQFPWGVLIFLLPIFLAPFADHRVAISENRSVYEISQHVLTESETEQSNTGKEIEGTFVDREGDDFAGKFFSIGMSPRQYVGEQVELKGFVYRADDRIVIGRLLISCCAADSQVAGFRVKGKATEKMQSDEWYHVVGTVEVEQIDSIALGRPIDMAVIRVISAEKIAPLKHPYIYP